jgi:hypothetical protein
MNFLTTLGVLSFLLSIIYCAYIYGIACYVWKILSSEYVHQSWIDEHFAPLVARQGLL